MLWGTPGPAWPGKKLSSKMVDHTEERMSPPKTLCLPDTFSTPGRFPPAGRASKVFRPIRSSHSALVTFATPGDPGGPDEG